MKEILRTVICLAGLSLLGVLVADILKKWQLISNSLSTVLVIIPILALFIVIEIIHSPYIIDSQELSPNTIRVLSKTLQITLLIISILVVVSAVFIWFGAIETTIRSSG